MDSIHRFAQIFTDWRVETTDFADSAEKSVSICVNLCNLWFLWKPKACRNGVGCPREGEAKTPAQRTGVRGNTAQKALSRSHSLPRGRGNRPRRATWLPAAARPRVTVAGQRRTFTGFAFQPAHPGVQAPWPNLGLIVSDFRGFAPLFVITYTSVRAICHFWGLLFQKSRRRATSQAVGAVSTAAACAQRLKSRATSCEVHLRGLLLALHRSVYPCLQGG